MMLDRASAATRELRAATMTADMRAILAAARNLEAAVGMLGIAVEKSAELPDHRRLGDLADSLSSLRDALLIAQDHLSGNVFAPVSGAFPFLRG